MMRQSHDYQEDILGLNFYKKHEGVDYRLAAEQQNQQYKNEALRLKNHCALP